MLLTGLLIVLSIFLVYLVIGYKDRIRFLESRVTECVTVSELNTWLKNKDRPLQEIHDEYLAEHDVPGINVATDDGGEGKPASAAVPGA